MQRRTAGATLAFRNGATHFTTCARTQNICRKVPLSIARTYVGRQARHMPWGGKISMCDIGAMVRICHGRTRLGSWDLTLTYISRSREWGA